LSLVGKSVLLSLVVGSDVCSHFSELGLNLIGVDDSCNISASHGWSVKSPAFLLVRWGLVGSEHGIKSLESVLSEDDESSKMTSWGELKDV